MDIPEFKLPSMITLAPLVIRSHPMFGLLPFCDAPLRHARLQAWGPLVAISGCSAVSPRTSAVGQKADLRAPMSGFRRIASASGQRAGPALKARFRRLLTRRRHSALWADRFFKNVVNVRLWLGGEVRSRSPVRQLYPRKPTFERQRPLWTRFRRLHLQERTCPAVPPLDWF